MTTLSVFEKDGLEIVIDLKTGASYATQSAYARMSGKSKSTISERMHGVREEDILTAEIQTRGGLQRVRLIPARLAFQWALKDNQALAAKMGEAGCTVFFHQIAGYKVTSQEDFIKPQSQLEILSLAVQQLVELDKRQKEIEQQNVLLTANLQSVQSDVKEIQDRAYKAEKELKALPSATKECPRRTVRTNINTLVRTYCYSTALSHREAWNNLYREFRDRCHIDLKIRAANGSCRPLDIAEALDVLDDLCAVAQEIMGGTDDA